MKKFVKLSFFQLNRAEKGFYLERSSYHLVNIDKIVTLESCELPELYTENPNTFKFGEEFNPKEISNEYPIIVFETEYFNQFIAATGIYSQYWLRDELHLSHNQFAPKLVATCSLSELEQLISTDLTDYT